MSGSRNEPLTINVTVEITGQAAVATLRIEIDPDLQEAEEHYCERRAAEVSERNRRNEQGRLRRLIAHVGLCGAGALLLVVIGTLAFSILTNPLLGIGAAGVLALILRATLQLVGQVAAEGDPTGIR